MMGDESHIYQLLAINCLLVVIIIVILLLNLTIIFVRGKERKDSKNGNKVRHFDPLCALWCVSLHYICT